MARSTTPTCCLTLPLVVEPWQAHKLEVRFELARQIYNSFLGKTMKRLRFVEHLKEYIQIQTEMKLLFQEGKSGTKEYKLLAKQRRDILKQNGFTEYAFTTQMKNFYKWAKPHIGSIVAQSISNDIWRAFDTYLFHKGRRLHIKRKGAVSSVAGKGGTNGPNEILYKNGKIVWNKLVLTVKHNPRNEYERHMLDPERHRLKYCRILRKPSRNVIHYYVQFVLEGRPEIKVNPDTGEMRHPLGSGCVGIDIGPQTIAYSAETEVNLVELADRVQNIEQQKRILQRKIERSRRANNPENYKDNGPIQRGKKLIWHNSKRYEKTQRELAYLQRRQAEIRKLQHIELANHLLSLGDRFIIEDMSWPSLTKRAKKTEISEKTGRYKKKKRFGKSIANKAPATLVQILNTKLISLGLEGVNKVPTTLRASQYNHITEEYVKKELSQRWNEMPDGTRVQRDLYSAFLLQYVDATAQTFNQTALKKNYPKFLTYHDAVIERLKTNPKNIASMGLRGAKTKLA